MVIKLIKHDFKESSRKFAPVIGMIITVSLMLIFMMKSSIDGWGAEFVVLTMMFLVFGLSIASLVLTVMAMIDLLYTSVYNKRGYQLFTLPVKPWEILVSKLVLVIVWMSIIGLLTMLCAGIVLAIVFSDAGVWNYISSFFGYLFSSIDARVYAVSFFNNFVSTFYSFSLFMLLGSIIHSSFVQSGRNIKMLIAYLITTVVIANLMSTFISSDLVLNFVINENAIMGGAIQDPMVNGWGEFFTVATNIGALQNALWLGVLQTIIASGAFYGTIWFWNNKLEVID